MARMGLTEIRGEGSESEKTGAAMRTHLGANKSAST